MFSKIRAPYVSSDLSKSYQIIKDTINKEAPDVNLSQQYTKGSRQKKTRISYGQAQAPSPLSKMGFEYQGIIFNEKKVLKFSQMLSVRLGVCLTEDYPPFLDP